MDKVKVGQGGWVVVCDGAKALVFENVGDEKFPNLKARDVRIQADAKTSDIGTDRPGRSFSSVGHGRSAVEQTDWHDQAEEAFLTALAGSLAAAAQAGETKSMVIVAAPRALGVLRQHYTPALKKAVVAEIHKDYVKLPVHEIEKLLLG
jgi:protein required for attachment to host cells